MNIETLLLLLIHFLLCHVETGHVQPTDSLAEKLGESKSTAELLQKLRGAADGGGKLRQEAQDAEGERRDELEAAAKRAAEDVRHDVEGLLNVQEIRTSKTNATERLCQLITFPQRLLSAVGFSVAYQAWFGSFSIDHGINYTDFFNTLSGFFENDTEVVVPAGVGTYRGLQDASEYLIIALQAANMGFWRTGPEILDASLIPNVRYDGNVIQLSGTVTTSFFNGEFDVDLVYDLRVSFKPCAIFISKYEVLYSDSFGDIIAAFVNTVRNSKYQGLYDMCMYHEKYCVGEDRQYDNFTSCLEYMQSLPLISDECGDSLPLAGNSQSCSLTFF